MIKNIQEHQRKNLYRFLGLQALITLVVSGVLGLIWGVTLGSSVLAGALTSILGNGCLASRFFADKKSFAGRVVLTDLYRGEIVKIAVTVALFFFAIKVIHVEFAGFISAFVMTQLLTSFMLLFWKRAKKS